MRIFLALLAGLCFAVSLPSAEVPAPFTPIKATHKSFRVLNREVTLGSLLLPASISAKGAPLLSSPVTLVSAPSKALDIIPESVKSRLVNNDGDSAEWIWVGLSRDFSISNRMTAACDGFCWYEIDLVPRGDTRIKALQLTIPRAKATARYLHTASYDWSNGSQGLPELGGKWSGAFLPYLWLGDENRGLAWCAESDVGSALSAKTKGIEIQTEDENILCTINFVDHETILKKPIFLRFGLQASPVKDIHPEWRAKARILHDIHYDSCHAGTNGRCELDDFRDGGVKTVVIHDSWTKYFGQMQPTDPDAFRALIKACHKRGLRLLVYVGYGVARTAPELQGKHDEWSVQPLIPWDPGYKPETRAFDATCAKSGWADWLVAGTEKLFTDYDLDGLYFDGTSEAWRCMNQAHGCGWTDENGTLHAEFPINAARQLMRHMAAVVRLHKPNAILDVHMSSNLTLPTLSFCDSLWNGEQFESHTAAEKFEVPLHVFRTEFMGYAHGMDMEFLCYENRPFTFPEAIALAWLHGIEVRPYPKSLHNVTPLWRALDKFGTAKATWHPYWEGVPLAQTDNANTKISAWTRSGRELLFISHLARTNETVQIVLSRNAAELSIPALKARDAITGGQVEIINHALPLTFAGMNYRLVEVY